MKQLSILPGEEPFDLNGCNYDIYSSKRIRNVTVTIRGFADVVTHQRKKLSESAGKKKIGKDEGWNTLRSDVFFL